VLDIHYWLDSKSADFATRVLPENFSEAINNVSKLRNRFSRVDIFVGDDLSKKMVKRCAKAKGIKLKIFL